MPLSKYPIEIPLGGAVDEGNVPEVVQPPRIREAVNCVSIKGGAYSKKDAVETTVAVPASTFEVEHTGQETVCFQPQSVAVLSDLALSTPGTSPSGAGRNEVRGLRVSESNAVKQHGDHATVVLPDGQERTLCLWNSDAGSGYRAVTSTSTFSAVLQDSPSNPVQNSGYSYYPTGGVRGALLIDGVPQSPELDNLAPVDRQSFPRVRARGITGFVTCANLMTPQLKDIAGDPVDSSYGAHLDSWSFGDPSDPLSTASRYGRDILNEYAGLGLTGFFAPTETPGAIVQIRNLDGTVLGAATVDDIGDDLTPILELVVRESPSEAYTLHIQTGAGNDPDSNLTQAVINRWDVGGGVPVPMQPPLLVLPAITSPSGVVPCGLHDTGTRLLLVWSDTSLTRLNYDLTTPPGAQVAAFWDAGEVTGLYLGRKADLSSRCVYRDNGSATDEAYRLARGCWPGSFLAKQSDDPADDSFWIGVQVMCDLNEFDLGLQQTGEPLPGDYRPAPAFASVPSSAIPHPCSIVHSLVTSDGIPVGPLPFQDAGIIPGATIASQGGFVEGVGACVCIHATATGDDRTAIQWKSAGTRTDAISPTCFLITRTEQPAQQYSPENYPEPDRVLWSPNNQSIAVSQVLALGACIGTTMVNPYQVRTNLDIGAWGCRFVGFERSGVISEDDFVSPPPGALVTGEPEILTGSASLASVSLFTFRESARQTERVADYALIDGAMPVACGTGSALAQGSGLQAPVDAVLPSISAEIVPATINTGFEIGDLVPEDEGLNVSSHVCSYDAVGGQHRSVPYSVTNGYVANAQAGSQDPYSSAVVRLYPHPWMILGLPSSSSVDAQLYAAPTTVGVEAQAVSCAVPLMTHEMLLVQNPELSTISPALRADVFGKTTAGDGSGLYTAAGELAADAPAPSLDQAVVNNRVWSISGTDSRTAQYSKVLKRGYAPEWNGNLTVRVPDTELPLTAVGALPDGRVLLFSPTSIFYTYGAGPSDAGQGAGFAEPALLTDTVGCANKRSIAVGDFGCMFRGDRGFYLVDRQLALTYVGLPYEDTTAEGVVLASATDGLRSEIIFYVGSLPGDAQQRWVFNYLRQQWSTFVGDSEATAATERKARPLALAASSLEFPTSAPAALISATPPFDQAMSITTGWVAMGKIQGYGRTWEVQLTGIRDPGSLSGLRVEIYYDYIDTPLETYDFDDVGSGQFKVRFRPRKQKSEAISFRFSEYVPVTVPLTDPADCTGWRLDMCTVLAGVKAGLDKVAVTVRSS